MTSDRSHGFEPHAGVPQLCLGPGSLVVTLPGLHRTASWALIGGGLSCADAVVWQQVRNQDLGPSTDPSMVLRRHLDQLKQHNAIGLMTSAPLCDYTVAQTVAQSDLGDVTCVCVATVGLSNAVSVGESPSSESRVDTGYVAGTINLLVWLSVSLTDAALIEAVSIAAEARTAAVLALKLPSVGSGALATGTGTDCIVAAAAPMGEASTVFAGKHTTVGAVIGRSVRRAVAEGLEHWNKRRGL